MGTWDEMEMEIIPAVFSVVRMGERGGIGNILFT